MRRSLLERLSNERDAEPRLALDYGSMADLRDAVSRDLEEMLNTRSESIRVLSDAFPQCVASSLTYGIPDFSSQTLAGQQDRDRIRRSLERAIALHEPRLSRVRITLDPQREFERALRFRVDAVLDVGPEHEKVRFDAVLQMATQVCAVA